MSARLLHYSDKLTPIDLGHKYVQDDVGAFSKPRGLWVSVEGEDDWASWCRDNGFGLERMAHCTEVALIANANILTLSSAHELDDFTARYGSLRNHRAYDDGIRWAEVAAQYNGIIIAPYQWERRLGLSWYYGWDCASGVIWNLWDAVSYTRVVDCAATAPSGAAK